MFIDDLKDIRNQVKQSMHEILTAQVVGEKKFAKERDFFKEQINDVRKANAKLQSIIEQLTKDLDYEKNYNLQLFVDE